MIDQLEKTLHPASRLTVDEALAFAQAEPRVLASKYLTYLLIRAVERSGYDRGHAVATAEAHATEPREERDGDAT